MQLATIGYEGATLADLISTPVTAGVERLIDVREIAQSRRPGFSENALRSALAEASTDYYHIRQLGDPKHGREAARAGNLDLFRTIFNAHMDLPASRDAVNDAIFLVSQKQSVLMCFERDPKQCHRTIVAKRMADLSSLPADSESRRATDGSAGGTNKCRISRPVRWSMLKTSVLS